MILIIIYDANFFIKNEKIKIQSTEFPFSLGKVIALPFCFVKVEPLRGFGKNLHPRCASGSIFLENLDKASRTMLFARKREIPCR